MKRFLGLLNLLIAFQMGHFIQAECHKTELECSAWNAQEAIACLREDLQANHILFSTDTYDVVSQQLQQYENKLKKCRQLCSPTSLIHSFMVFLDSSLEQDRARSPQMIAGKFTTPAFPQQPILTSTVCFQCCSNKYDYTITSPGTGHFVISFKQPFPEVPTVLLTGESITGGSVTLVKVTQSTISIVASSTISSIQFLAISACK